MAAWLGHFLSIWLGTDAAWSGMINMIKGDVTAGTDAGTDVDVDVSIDVGNGVGTESDMAAGLVKEELTCFRR